MIQCSLEMIEGAQGDLPDTRSEKENPGHVRPTGIYRGGSKATLYYIFVRLETVILTYSIYNLGISGGSYVFYQVIMLHNQMFQ